MAVKIDGVEKNSLAEKVGIKAEDTLISINGNEINDLLDYRFYMTDKKLDILCESGSFSIEKSEYDDIGIEFDTYLMDKKHSCKNACIFCFVDQMPPNMRESLYFKDDDERLSFLFGNYISLTNLNDAEVDRIIKMRISPINISVHTTNPDLRVKMMKNPRSGEVLSYIKKFADADIKINTQLVLCPDYNDGEELKRSLNDLGELYPGVQSIACVPVGLTKYRDKLAYIKPYEKDNASQAIDIIEEFAEKMTKKHGERFAYPSDELFLRAERELPDYDYYGEFNQLENGVGLLTLLLAEFEDACAMANDFDKERTVSIATGVDAYPYILSCANKAMEIYGGLKVSVYAIKNEYFGESITVTGLLTATDIIKQLKGKELGEELIITSSMLKHEEDKFLDDYTVEELTKELGTAVNIIDPDGFELLGAMIGEEDIYGYDKDEA